MPTPRRDRSPSPNRSSGGARGSSRRSSAGGGPGKLVLAFVLGAAAAAGAGYLYLHSSPHPHPRSAATAPQPAPPASHTAAKPPPPAVAPSAPFGISEDVFEAGAHIYANRCAACHGTPHAAALSKPPAPQLWRADRSGLVARSPGEIYLATARGNPAKGMPAYTRVLTETQLWQVALLLRNADVDLPDPVVHILNTPPRH